MFDGDFGKLIIHFLNFLDDWLLQLVTDVSRLLFLYSGQLLLTLMAGYFACVIGISCIWS